MKFETSTCATTSTNFMYWIVLDKPERYLFGKNSFYAFQGVFEDLKKSANGFD